MSSFDLENTEVLRHFFVLASNGRFSEIERLLSELSDTELQQILTAASRAGYPNCFNVIQNFLRFQPLPTWKAGICSEDHVMSTSSKVVLVSYDFRDHSNGCGFMDRLVSKNLTELLIVSDDNNGSNINKACANFMDRVRIIEPVNLRGIPTEDYSLLVTTYNLPERKAINDICWQFRWKDILCQYGYGDPIDDIMFGLRLKSIKCTNVYHLKYESYQNFIPSRADIRPVFVPRRRRPTKYIGVFTATYKLTTRYLRFLARLSRSDRYRLVIGSICPLNRVNVLSFIKECHGRIENFELLDRLSFSEFIERLKSLDCLINVDHMGSGIAAMYCLLLDIPVLTQEGLFFQERFYGQAIRSIGARGMVVESFDELDEIPQEIFC